MQILGINNYYQSKYINTKQRQTDKIKQLQDNGIPEHKNTAHEILCEYWGESFVNRVEASMKKQ